MDIGRIAVAGESAGAGLAAGSALYARDHDLPAPRTQYLGIPALEPPRDTIHVRLHRHTRLEAAECPGGLGLLPRRRGNPVRRRCQPLRGAGARRGSFRSAAHFPGLAGPKNALYFRSHTARGRRAGWAMVHLVT
ncbi:alpha/beta hydrolase fold domain-containing protein [Streptomyces argyrophylli]|uniref:alpha/beta hydrolase fold domain-containing protein n=1 Tax=Streptomyces argyrophylli TaxID=2726118 RepID=UPI0028688C1D|nr:alpha/beta hydrolase fold domain-containing protein [Streptomyces argyrophyllae]